MPHGLEKFHQYWFAQGVSLITNDKQLAAVFKKHAGNPSNRLQRVLLWIHINSNSQYYVRPEPELFITDLILRHNNKANIDKEIAAMGVLINTIELYTDIPDCMTSKAVREVTLED